jgi:hypothetical protein
MSMMLIAGVYFILSGMVGLCSIGRKPGFVVSFLLSWLITPFFMLIILYITRERVQPAVQ